MQRFEHIVGLRYTRAKRRNHFISFISMISMAGIGLGVAALIIVLSVMNGFQNEMRDRILGVASHVQIYANEDTGLSHWQEIMSQTTTIPHVTAAAPYIMGQGMLTSDNHAQGAIIRGILPTQEATVADLGQHMKVGSLDNLKAGQFGVVIGSALADHLHVNMGDKVILITPQGQVTPAGMLPRLKQFTVVGIFSVGMYEYDSGLALIQLNDAQRLFRLGEDVSGIRLKLDNLMLAPNIANQLVKTLPIDAWVSDWTREHANLFRAVAIEKNVMFIILLLIVAVAAFNIVSTLVMAVTDKQADIAILRTLGASSQSIMQIFIIQGALIGLVGTLGGMVFGVIIALNIHTIVPFIEHLFGVHFLSPQVYFISELPSQLEWSDVLTIAITSFVLTLIATLYPSYRASKIQPAEALRYE
ncbi:lipoprotein-releasing ABC transporter permease subunit [Ferrovum sp. PN-J185]|uniref:lipoprotein-releasing ABC transporter permease subunit n=1 Tax=Ferrovum sp. PN-J185 TaxID=1356306 RepID=UPI000791CDDB|nr:lipoprotein-releasing ABC transporter permease subunit [Ferrovum sp. PN-J185]KXW56348.1 lipoprotein-releasing system transmembrane protein LolE [Ferrovum sp. PN-J185]MCC6069072.1 lipoprotein-releasing ABC transporter permease subunit [Ferrovum sp. PN-J185]